MGLIAADAATQRWWRLTDPCQERLPGTADGRQWLELPEVWHMD
jgi:L-rhamnose mutarotase